MPETIDRSPRTPAAYVVGDIINARYEVLAILGSGAFSTVYRVFDSARGHECALKVFGHNFGLDVARRELRALMSLRHPNVVEVIDVGQTSTQPSLWFLKSEYVEGDLLCRFTDPGGERLPSTAALAAADQILDALQVIHPQTARIEELKSQTSLNEDEYQELMQLQETGLIHRDIKPQNIIRTMDGSVKLLDFNIATPAGAAVLTTSGTPAYTPPEVNLAAWDVSPDLFAIGVVLYELLTQHHPYPDRQPRPGIEPRNPVELNHDVPEAIGEVVRKMCLPRGEDRFDSALDVRVALAEASREELGAAVTPYPDPVALVDAVVREGSTLGGQKLELSPSGSGVWGVVGSPDGYSIDLHVSSEALAIELVADSQEVLQRLRERDEHLAVLGEEPARTPSGTRWVLPASGSPDAAAGPIAKALAEVLLLAVEIVEHGATDTTIPTMPLGKLPDGHFQVGWITTPDIRVPFVIAEHADSAPIVLSAMTASGVHRYSAPRGAYLWDATGRAIAYESIATAKWTIGTDVAPVSAPEHNGIQFVWRAPIPGLNHLDSIGVTVEDRAGSAFVTASGHLKALTQPPRARAPRVRGEMTIDQFLEARVPDDDTSADVLRSFVADATGLGVAWELGKSSSSADGHGAYAMIRVSGLGAQGQIGFLWPGSHRLDLRLDREWARGRTFATSRKSARANAFQVQVDLRSEPARLEAIDLLNTALQLTGASGGHRK